MAEIEPVWIDRAVAAVALIILGSISWFWRFVMGHNKRLAALEANLLVTNAHLGNMEKSLDKMVDAMEGQGKNHREDIIKAYEKVEAVHLVVIETLTRGKKND